MQGRTGGVVDWGGIRNLDDLSLIQNVIDEYFKSEVQSEAEVSSKFIAPLAKALGYPIELMALEFPVYGFGGREKLPAKDADFLFFTDKEFGKHRTNTQKNKNWVEDHSLLVIESKKPGKIPDDLGQAQFYTMWTKAVAYIETDGIDFMGYFWNPLALDREVIHAKVEELAKNPKILNFSYKNLVSIKSNGNGLKLSNSGLLELEDGVLEVINDDADLDIPEDTIAYIRECLGKNATGLTNVQAISRFLNTTESMLRNDMRYGIPPYMIEFPRRSYKAKLYIDELVFPLTTGEVTEFYCNEISRYYFQSEYIEAFAVYDGVKLSMFEIGFHVLNRTVSDRIDGFELVRKCLYSQNIRIILENESGMQISLPAGHPKKMWTLKNHTLHMHQVWLEEMHKLKAIEDYYEIEFKLEHVSDQKELNDLYQAIDFVYDGIMLNENCTITVPSHLIDEDLVIDAPVLFEEDKIIPLRDRIIQGVIFRPFRSACLPCKIKRSDYSEDDIIRIPGCCEYKIVEAAG